MGLQEKDFTYHLVMTFTVRHGFSMALIEIDASPINSMVDLSMVNCSINNGKCHGVSSGPSWDETSFTKLRLWIDVVQEILSSGRHKACLVSKKR